MNCCQGAVAAADSILVCSLCKGKYHYECLNVTSNQYAKLSKEYKASWKCPACSNVTRRNKSNVNTPVRKYTQQVSDENIMDVSCDHLEERSAASACIGSGNIDQTKQTSDRPLTGTDFEKFTSQLHTTLGLWRNEMNSEFLQIRQDIKSAMANIQKEVTSLRTEQTLIKQNVANIRIDVDNLKILTEDQKKEHDALKIQMNGMNSSESGVMESIVSALETKIDILEQQARQCNVEIGNLPERSNEDLPALIEAIGLALKCPILKQSIVAIHRVPHAQQLKSRPKNIIVRFTTSLHRDNLLSAFRKVASLKTDDIGLTTVSAPIYINEHLTLKKKHLFRKAREAAKKHDYKYVWVRNATILVREDAGKVAFAIRGEKDLDKIKASISQ